MEATLTRDDMRHWVDEDTVDDEVLDDMIADVLATATTLAPCLDSDDLSDKHARAAIAIFRAAILRWVDSISGAVTQLTAGPFGQAIDTSVRRTGLLQPSEISQLQAICKAHQEIGARQAFTLSRLGGEAPNHAMTCSVYFGGDCSCGAILTLREPLWGY